MHIHSLPYKIVPVPAVNAAILNEKGEVLLTRRSQKIREPGKWCLPGGHLDGGEDWVSAAKREVLEETGLEVKKLSLLGIYSDPTLTVTAEPVRSDGAHVQFLVITFLVQEYGGEVKPNDEVDAWGWFTSEKLPSPMVKSHPIRVQDALKFTGEVFVR